MRIKTRRVYNGKPPRWRKHPASVVFRGAGQSNQGNLSVSACKGKIQRRSVPALCATNNGEDAGASASVARERDAPATFYSFTISTRRFLALPSSVALPTMGLEAPKPADCGRLRGNLPGEQRAEHGGGAVFRKRLVMAVRARVVGVAFNANADYPTLNA
ncbi:MAG: hypothetical protein LBO79_02055 [Zoogloeaceae bacterium]|jgi:hypothetical protein|nr:hypothetical protein [Zoogloeaceae bacterium]